MRTEPPSHGVRRDRNPIRPLSVALLAVALTVFGQTASPARVLSDGDLAVIARIAPAYTEIVTDVSQTSRRQDLSSGDSDCIKSTLGALLQISAELKSYESLITIEGELKDFGDDETLKGILRFAVANAMRILDAERKRLSTVSDECSRHSLAVDKTRRAIDFIDNTTAVLKSVQQKL